MFQLFGVTMKILLVSLFSSMMYVTAAQSAHNIPSSTGYSPCFDGSAIKFRTGFESQTKVISSKRGQRAKFTGLDDADACDENSRVALPGGFRLGRADIQFQGGTHKDRTALIIEEPGKPGNHVLQFWLQSPNVPASDQRALKGRVQMNLYNNKGIRQVKMSVRMFLHPDFNYVRSSPGKVDWLTISEWWNNAGWTKEQFPFRIAVHIVKESPSELSPLVFKVHAQTPSKGEKKNRWNRKVWERMNKDFVIPVGQWVTLEYGFFEGDNDNGRFFLAATVEGGTRNVIFDITDYTQHPDDPSPNGLSDFNPLKLYTSSKLVDFVRSKGGALQMFWDDLQLTACSADEETNNSACSISQ